MSGPKPLLEYWYEALRQPVGVCLETTDAQELVRELRRAKDKAMDPTLDVLVTGPSPTTPETQVWIIHYAPNDRAGAVDAAHDLPL